MEFPGERARRVVYRRGGAVVFFVAIGVLLLGIAGAVTESIVRTDGWRGAVVPWALAVPAAAMAVLAGVLPRLVVTDEHIEVHNLFVLYVIPYGMITEAKFGRLGLAVRVVSGQLVPVLAFGHSTLANLLTGDASGQRALADINARVMYLHTQGGPAVRRRVKRVEIVALAVLVLAAVVALALA